MENRDVLSMKASELDEFLEGLKGTTPDAPYKLNIEGFTRESVDILRKHPEIYVDLSETKITTTKRSMYSYFYDCEGLVVPPVIPKRVTDMSYCFSCCTNLRKAPVIPTGVKEMRHCFEFCYILEKAPDIPNGVINMRGCFSFCKKLKEISNLPDSVTNMTGCFCGCEELKEIQNFPKQVLNLEKGFTNCTKLEKIPTIPESVTWMVMCFYNCPKLEKISLQYNEHCCYTDFVKAANIKTIQTDKPELLRDNLIRYSQFSKEQAASIVQPIGKINEKTVFDTYIDKVKESVSAAKTADLDTILKAEKDVLASLSPVAREEVHKAFLAKGLTDEKMLSAFMKKAVTPPREKSVEKKRDAERSR